MIRVITQKLHNATFQAKHANLRLVCAILWSSIANLRFQNSTGFRVRNFSSLRFDAVQGRCSISIVIRHYLCKVCLVTLDVYGIGQAIDMRLAVIHGFRVNDP